MKLAGSKSLAVLWLVFAAFASSPTAAQAQQTTIAGRVTEQGSGQPVPEARVMVLGTNLFAISNAEGRYTIRNVPAGPAEIRVLRVGYQEQKKPVTITAGAAATVDFSMTAIAVKLTEVVTTVTGATPRVELGNSIPQIDAASLVGTAPVASLTDLLTTRAPGVQVLPNNLTGTSARIRIRGTHSLSLSSSPIYIIDGVRMTSAPAANTLSPGGATIGRMTDVNPNDIENIEVVRGPSAATLYGTDAVNGVIVITTKKGRAGDTRWQTHAEAGVLTHRSEFPTAYALWGTLPNAAATKTAECTLTFSVANLCSRDSLTSFNLFENDETTPLGTGYRQSYGASLSGGTETIRYFTSADFELQTDPITLPKFDEAVYNAQQVTIRPEWRRPNELQRTSLRLNVNAAPSSTLDLGVQSAFVQTAQRLPPSDNNSFGLFSNAYGGKGYRQALAPGDTTAGGRFKNGYRLLTPGEMYRQSTRFDINRFIGSVNANWRPTSWLSNRANVGVDFTNQAEADLCRRGQCLGNATRLLGFADAIGVRIFNYSADLGTTASVQLRPWLNSKTTVGAQYVNSQRHEAQTGARDLPPGSETVTDGATATVWANTQTLSKTLGLFVEQSVGIRDRLFVTGALRTDQNSAFGTAFQSVVYPKLSVSWIASEEEWFPRMDWLNSLRLRSAYGASGQQPGANDATRYLQAVTANVETADRPGVTTGALGNADLQPERATEWEGGFEAKLLGNRVSIDLGYYSMLTRDALVSRVLAPSSGAGNRTRRENLGSVKNAGVEGLLTAQVLDRPSLAWDVTLNASTNSNRLVTLGGSAPIEGTTISSYEGYPLFGYWERKYTFADADANSIITANEITVDTEKSFLGSSQPKHEIALTNGIDLFNRAVRISGLIDYKGGYKLENTTEEIRCQTRVNCRGVRDISAPLWEQARAVAIRELGTRTTYFGYIEDGSFLRFRELAVTYTPSANIAGRFLRARNANITFAARNLGVLWTDYTGIDPEMSFGQFSAQWDFQTAPTPSMFTLRLNLGF